MHCLLMFSDTGDRYCKTHWQVEQNLLFHLQIFLIYHLCLSRCMSLATSKPKVTAHTEQVGYASLYTNSNETDSFIQYYKKTQKTIELT